MHEKHPRNAHKKFESCIFCDNTADTAEHIIPKWLGKMLCVTENAVTGYQEVHPIDGVISKRLKASSPITGFTTKCVCSTCNNGWMSQAVEAAKPLVAELVRGEFDGILEEVDKIKLLKNYSIFSAVVDVSTSVTGPALTQDQRNISCGSGVLTPYELYLGISECFHRDPPFNVGIERRRLINLRTNAEAHIEIGKRISTIIGHLAILCDVNGIVSPVPKGYVRIKGEERVRLPQSELICEQKYLETFIRNPNDGTAPFGFGGGKIIF